MFLLVVTLCIALVFSDTVGRVPICPVDTYRGLLQSIFSPSMCLSGDKQAMLVSSLADWSFANIQVLAELPVEVEKRNYVRRKVRGAILSRASPTPLKTPLKLAIYSRDVLENILTMNANIADSEDFLHFVSGNSVLEGSSPLCHRYGGHQFGFWAGQLGDGRAHLLGEFVSPWSGERWELQLKGSGLTPYSRDGDGRAVIRSSVREFLASEAMYYLDIPTSRAATLVVSEERVWRDQFYNGRPSRERAAVVLRLAQSWFRIGSFEILANNGEINQLRQLADFVIRHHFPGVEEADPGRYLDFFSRVVEKTAAMIASWQAVGFVHGVCNTDNFSILSLTIDYGPFGFMDAYDPDMVPNTSDDEAMYSYRKQPDVGYFNLNKLKQALLPLLDSNQQEVIEQVLAGYKGIFQKSHMKLFRQKLGITGEEGEDDETIINLLLTMMKETKADFTMTFRQIGDWNLQDIKNKNPKKNLWAISQISHHEWFDYWCNLYHRNLDKSGITEEQRRDLMQRTNPRYVLRNWIAEEVIRLTEKDDFSGLERVHRVLRRPYEEQEEAELAGYADPPPPWASQLRVSCSS